MTFQAHESIETPSIDAADNDLILIREKALPIFYDVHYIIIVRRNRS